MIRPVLRPRRWALHVACNDPETGRFAGEIEYLDIGAGRGTVRYGTDWPDDYFLRLQGPPLSFDWAGSESACWIANLYVPCTGITPSVGNWCWDACFIDKEAVRALCTHLRILQWSPEEGTTRLWRWYEGLAA